MNKKKSFNRWFFSFSKNENGAAALMAVVFAILIIGTIAVNFLVESQQKQAGGVATYTSTNAFLTAEAGLRFAEKCLLEGGTTELGCPCKEWTGGCEDWETVPTNILTNWATGTSFPADTSFGDSRGSFEILVEESTSKEIKVTSIGKFAGAIRSFSKTVAINCALSTNAITSCFPINTNNNSNVEPPSAPTVEGECEIPPVPEVLLTNFPDDPAADCTVAGGDDYEDLIPGSTYTDSDVKVCNWTQSSGTTTFGTALGTTNVWIVGDVTLTNNTDVQILGDVEFKIYGNVILSNQTEILVGDTTPTEGTMTMQTRLDFTMQNNTKINRIMDDAADVLLLIGGDGEFKNNILFTGGIYGASLDFDLENNAEFTGSIVANSVNLSNNATLVFDDTAGLDSDSYEFCGGGGNASIPQES